MYNQILTAKRKEVSTKEASVPRDTHAHGTSEIIKRKIKLMHHQIDQREPVLNVDQNHI